MGPCLPYLPVFLSRQNFVYSLLQSLLCRTHFAHWITSGFYLGVSVKLKQKESTLFRFLENKKYSVLFFHIKDFVKCSVI